jgi:transposase-like protein
VSRPWFTPRHSAHPPDPLIDCQKVGAEKDKKIMPLIGNDPEKHSVGHRTDALDTAAGDGEGVLLPTRAHSCSAPDPRSDRRKYLVPDQHIGKVMDACRRGVSEVRIARSLGINYRTWMRLRDEDERIAGALAESRKIEEEELVAVLLDKAREGETTSLIFALKSRHGYRDQGTPQTAADARVNVVINLPAASASAEDYARTIDGAVVS